jgi:hypothetical protein
MVKGIDNYLKGMGLKLADPAWTDHWKVIAVADAIPAKKLKEIGFTTGRLGDCSRFMDAVEAHFSGARAVRFGRITDAEIEAAKSPKGGWKRETLAEWGVPWPPPKGWRKKLVRDGLPYI